MMNHDDGRPAWPRVRALLACKMQAGDGPMHDMQGVQEDTGLASVVGREAKAEAEEGPRRVTTRLEQRWWVLKDQGLDRVNGAHKQATNQPRPRPMAPSKNKNHNQQ